MSRKRHVVKNLRLSEISSVDRPAQVGAVSVLIKRAEPREVELCKITFNEALKGCLLADKVRDAFYSAFEDLWEGKEAFRKALIDELAAGGDGSNSSEAFKTWLGGLVDQALGAAKALDAGSMADAELEKTILKAAGDWLANQETDMTIKTKDELQAAITKALAAGDNVTVGDIAVIHKAAAALNAEDLLPVEGALAKATAPVDQLDPKTKKKAEQMVKRDALAADLRKHYDTLDTDEQRDAFLAKSETEQQEVITKASGDDPVVYTTLDGIDIRKSADPTLLALAKSNDDKTKRLAKAEAAQEDVELTKRAGDMLGNIGGELLGKKALLKALDSITDASTRAQAEGVLKAANEASKGLFKNAGGQGSNATSQADDAASEAETQLDELAKAHAKDNNCDYHTAYAAVIQTTDGAALYKRYVAGE